MEFITPCARDKMLDRASHLRLTFWLFFSPFYVQGAPEGSSGSVSGFRASQKAGYSLKPHPTDWEKPGIEPATPGLQDIGFLNLLIKFINT